MAKQANILTFDDAKTASRRRRGFTPAPGAESALREERFSPYSSPRNSDFVKPKGLREPYPGEYEGVSDFGYCYDRGYDFDYGYGYDYDYGYDYGRGYGYEPDFEPLPDEFDGGRSRSARQASSRRSRSSRDSLPRTGRQASPRAEEGRVKPESKRERRRRERAKSRAEKLFVQQYESDGAASDQQEGAPRAALYAAEMGSSHRKSARMQRSSVAPPQTAKINPAGWFSNLNVSARSLKMGTALLCLVLVGLFLYTPAQQYYQSVREHDKLVAQYAVIEQRNEQLGEQNEALASNAGMEDAVRQRYGYVVGGDETAVVSGLSDYATDPSRDSDGIEANVLASSVKAPEEWYTPYLDAFFGVS